MEAAIYGAWLNHPDYAPLVDPLYLVKRVKDYQRPINENELFEELQWKRLI
jgi:hypothetical protein